MDPVFFLLDAEYFVAVRLALLAAQELLRLYVAVLLHTRAAVQSVVKAVHH